MLFNDTKLAGVSSSIQKVATRGAVLSAPATPSVRQSRTSAFGTPMADKSGRSSLEGVPEIRPASAGLGESRAPDGNNTQGSSMDAPQTAHAAPPAIPPANQVAFASASALPGESRAPNGNNAQGSLMDDPHAVPAATSMMPPGSHVHGPSMDHPQAARAALMPMMPPGSHSDSAFTSALPTAAPRNVRFAGMDALPMVHPSNHGAQAPASALPNYSGASHMDNSPASQMIPDSHASHAHATFLPAPGRLPDATQRVPHAHVTYLPDQDR